MGLLDRSKEARTFKRWADAGLVPVSDEEVAQLRADHEDMLREMTEEGMVYSDGTALSAAQKFKVAVNQFGAEPPFTYEQGIILIEESELEQYKGDREDRKGPEDRIDAHGRPYKYRAGRSYREVVRPDGPGPNGETTIWLPGCAAYNCSICHHGHDSLPSTHPASVGYAHCLPGNDVWWAGQGLTLDELRSVRQDAVDEVSRSTKEIADAATALDLGVLLEDQGDIAGAEAAYRRADELGDAAGAFNLALLLLTERGDLPGAEAAYRRADERGDAEAALEIAHLLKERGDLSGAEGAYQRAAQRGDVGAAVHVGVLLMKRGDLAGAETALRQADDGGHTQAPFWLGGLLRQLGDLSAAEDAYHRGDERGSGPAAYNLGVMLAKRGDLAGSEAAYRRAAERGYEP
jgi:tetratricopeptide (TPR) repeat protein